MRKANRHIFARLMVAVAATSILSACGEVTGLLRSSADGGPNVFLVQTVAQTVVMDALFEGAVIRDEVGCFRLGTAAGPTPIWPKGFTLDDAGPLRVLDDLGREVGRIGGRFRLGGGEVPFLHEGIALTDEDRRVAEERCPGRYWIVGEIPRD